MKPPPAFPSLLRVLALLSVVSPIAEARPPDVVVIMADDLGFSDLGCYGSEIPTPNLDQLAANGIRFTNFSNTSRCCPSRASLLTGLHQHQAGIGAMNHPGKGPGYAGQLRAEVSTLPEFLKSAGYATAMVGKWHLTLSKTIDDGPNGSWPFERGFDRYFGSMEGAKNYFHPQWLFRDREEVTDFAADFFYTDAMADNAVRFIRERNMDTPLFLYAAFYAPHFPLQAPAEMIAKFRGRYRAGWDVLRERRFARQIAAGILPAGTRLSPRPDSVPAWDTLSARQRDALDLRMAVYAAQVHLLDRGVGRIVEALRETGRLDNTLLIFLSDNGGTDSGGAFGKGALSRVGRPDADLHTTYGAGWANLSNTPYRLYKANTHEGGVMSPLILHWPERCGRQARLRDESAHITDIAATCLAAAGIGGDRLEGIDLLDVSPTTVPRAIFYEHLNSRAVREGRWKLVNRGRSGRWELYDLKADRTELQDLAAERPDQVHRLGRLWTEWAQRCHVRAPQTAAPRILDGIVVDDAEAEFVGPWATSANLKGFVGRGYRYAEADTGATATFEVIAKAAGLYDVQLGYQAYSKRGSTVPVTVESSLGMTRHVVDMRVPEPLPGGFISLGVIRLRADQKVIVRIRTDGAGGRVSVDAARLLRLNSRN